MKQFGCPKDIESFQFLKEDIFMVVEYQTWDNSVNHTSSNQVNCKINYINVNKAILSHTHTWHCKINTQQKCLVNY